MKSNRSLPARHTKTLQSTRKSRKIPCTSLGTTADWIEAEVCGRSGFAAEAGFDCGSHRSSSNNGNDESDAETFASAGGAYSRSSNNGNARSHAEIFASGYGNRDLHGEGNIADDVLDFISSLLGGGNRS